LGVYIIATRLFEVAFSINLIKVYHNHIFTANLLVDKTNLGFGQRSWRYSMYVEDGEIKQTFSEAGFEDNCETDPFEVSDADTMLNYLKNR